MLALCVFVIHQLAKIYKKSSQYIINLFRILFIFIDYKLSKIIKQVVKLQNIRFNQNLYNYKHSRKSIRNISLQFDLLELNNTLDSFADLMQIQNRSQKKISDHEYQSTPFYDLYQADQKIVNQLAQAINQFFSPLSWILQETLYKRIKKESKGWIQIDFLHKNQKFASILNKYQIPKHSRRKKNLLNKAIQISVIKKKRNLIKRKQFIKISQHAKKVLYFELRGFQQPLSFNLSQNNQIKFKQQAKFNTMKDIMKQSGLRNIIQNQIKKNIKIEMAQVNEKMQIQQNGFKDNHLNNDRQDYLQKSENNNGLILRQKSLNKNQKEDQNERYKKKINDLMSGIQFKGNKFENPWLKNSKQMANKLKMMIPMVVSSNNQPVNQFQKQLRQNLLDRKNFWQIQSFYEKNNSEIISGSEQAYRWCFIYLPLLSQHQIVLLEQSLKKTLKDKMFGFGEYSLHNQNSMNGRNYSNGINLELHYQIRNLNIQQNQANYITNQHPQRERIKIFTLEELLNKQKKDYKQICKQIGFQQRDHNQERLRIKAKKRELQKARLLESRYLDDKVDLVNNYHKKLQLQKQRREYFQKKQMEQQQKRKSKYQRRNKYRQQLFQPNAQNDKLQRLFRLNCEDQRIQPQIQKQNQCQGQIQNSNLNSCHQSRNSENQASQQSIGKKYLELGQKGQNIQVRIPKFLCDIAEDKQKTQKQDINMFSFEDKDNQIQDEQDYQSVHQRSEEQYEVPKKRSSRQNQQKRSSSTKKHKKIIKPSQKHNKKKMQSSEMLSSSRSKRLNLRNNNSKHNDITQIHESNGRTSQKLEQANSNGMYNLRHKSHTEGSYRKMVQFGESNQKEQNSESEDQNIQVHQYSTRNLKKSSKYN